MDVQPSNFGFSNSREEELSSDLLSNLPRAVFHANVYMILDGEWKFSLDPEDRGLSDNWPQGHLFEQTAEWPGTVEAHMLKAKLQLPVNTHKVVAWYERDFFLPEGKRQFPGSIIQLTFGACGYETRVWLNGVLLRTIEGEDTHYGEYTSFSYELDETLFREVNRLTVRIADSMDADVPRGKQESHVYKRGGIWYQTYSGAVRSVWLETVERNRLRSRIGVISVVEDNLVSFNLTTHINDPGSYIIRLQIFQNKKDKTAPLVAADFSLNLGAGQKRQRVVCEVPNAQIWSPEQPNLYWLVAQLIDSNGHVSQIESHFGLRKIEARGCTVYLNNKPIYLDGILYQPGMATYEEMKAHMHAMKALGCNLVRIHIAGVDPRVYKLADKIGLLLWVEVPSPHSSTGKSRQNHWDELQRMLAMIETHPSIVIWSLYNEDWGAQDIATNPETRQYIVDTYHYMKINHPQFLVVDNDGWQHVSVEGRLKSDLLTAHLYTPDLKIWSHLLERLTQGDMNVAAFPLVVGDAFFYRRQVPLLVSEWGGFGFADYGGPKDADEKARMIWQFKQQLRSRHIAGDIYTQATNIEDERNGVMDEHTAELKIPEGLLASVSRVVSVKAHM